VRHIRQPTLGVQRPNQKLHALFLGQNVKYSQNESKNKVLIFNKTYLVSERKRKPSLVVK